MAVIWYFKTEEHDFLKVIIGSSTRLTSLGFRKYSFSRAIRTSAIAQLITWSDHLDVFGSVFSNILASCFNRKPVNILLRRNYLNPDFFLRIHTCTLHRLKCWILVAQRWTGSSQALQSKYFTFRSTFVCASILPASRKESCSAWTFVHIYLALTRTNVSILIKRPLAKKGHVHIPLGSYSSGKTCTRWSFFRYREWYCTRPTIFALLTMINEI